MTGRSFVLIKLCVYIKLTYQPVCRSKVKSEGRYTRYIWLECSSSTLHVDS